MKLYELSQNYKNLLELLDNEEIPAEMLENALNEVKDDINIKAENICKVITNLNSDIDALKNEEKRLSTIRKIKENRVKNLKYYLESTFKELNIDKIEGDIFGITLAKNPPKLVLKDDFKPNDKYIIKEIKIDTASIKEDLKQGIEIDGAELVQEKGIRIR